MFRILIIFLPIISLIYCDAFAARWNGSSFGTTTSKRYSGSSWVNTTDYRYSGSAWVDITEGSTGNPNVVFYANADTLGTTPQKGTGPLTFSGGILLDTSTPILGAGSWNNNDDGFDRVTIPAANVNYDNSTVSFFWRPYENAAGYIFYGAGDSDFMCQYSDATHFWCRYKDQSFYPVHGITTWDGSTPYFIEIVMTGTTCTIYIDNVEKGSATGATGTITADLHLGTPNGNQWSARYDQAIITNSSGVRTYSLRNTTSF